MMAIRTLEEYLLTNDWPDELEPLPSGMLICHCGLKRRTDEMYDTQPPGLAVGQRLDGPARRARQNRKRKTLDAPRFLCGDALWTLPSLGYVADHDELLMRLGK